MAADATTTTAPDPFQQLLSNALTFIQGVFTNLVADEKAALKPVLLQFFSGLAKSPDLLGLQALVIQLQTGVMAAQVQVKATLAPQVAALGQAWVNSW